MLQEDPCTQNGCDTSKQKHMDATEMTHCKFIVAQDGPLQPNCKAHQNEMQKRLHIEINHLLEHTKIGTDQDGDAIDDIAKVDAAKTTHKHVCALLIALEKYDTPSANGQKQQHPPLLEGITYIKGETIDMNKYCKHFVL